MRLPIKTHLSPPHDQTYKTRINYNKLLNSAQQEI